VQSFLTVLRSLAPRNVVCFAVVFTLVARLALLLASPMRETTSYEQLIIARNAVTGHGFDMRWPYPPADSTRAALWEADPTPHPSAFMPPFVPAFYTAIFAMVGPGMTGVYLGLIIQCVVGALIPWLIYRIAGRFARQQAAALAGLLSIIYLPGLLSSATPSGAVWYAATALVVLDAAQRVYQESARAWQLGAAAGVLTLMRSEFLVVGILLCLVPLVQRRWKTSLIALSLMVSVIAPWTIRNTLQLGQPVAVITHPWREIWRGANERASGSGYDAEGWMIWEGERFPQIVHRLDSIVVGSRFELEADAVFRDEVMAYLRAAPVDWCILGLKKMLMLWTIDPYYPNTQHPGYVIPTLLTSLLIVSGGFLLLIRIRHDRTILTRVLPIALVGIMLTLLFGLTYVQPRYQTYVFTAMLPLSAIVFERLLAGRETNVRVVQD
jgi:hypothetical protein